MMPENISYSFMVRIWLESHEFPDEAFEWRGMIQNVINGEKKYFIDFDEMLIFLILQILQEPSEMKGSEK